MSYKQIFMNTKNFIPIEISQYDKGYTLDFELLNKDSTPFNIKQGQEVLVEWMLTNGHPCYQSGIENISYNVGSNKVSVKLTNTIARNSGTGEFNIVVVSIGDDEIKQRFGTFTNEYKVVGGAINVLEVSEEELTTVHEKIEGAIVKGESVVNQLNSITAQSKKDVENVKLWTSKIEQDIKTAQTIDTKLLNDNKTVNTTITNANNINNTLKTTTTTANTSKTNLDNSIATGNTTKTNIDNAVTEANAVLGKLQDTASGLNIQHMQIGGTNLLRASALKKNMDYINYWYASTAVWKVSDNTQGITPHGNRSFRGDCDNTSTYYGVHQGMYLKPNTTYTLSMWVNFDLTSGDDDTITMQCSCQDTTEKYYYLTTPIKAKDTTKGTWNLVTHTFTTRDFFNGSKQDICIQPNRSKFHGYVGDIKLEIGNHYSDWSPNLLDILLWNYPVGSKPYVSFDNINPNEWFGGEWRQLTEASGRVPVFSGTGKDVNGLSKTFTLKQNGGEYTHTLTKKELTPHEHEEQVSDNNGAGSTKGRADYKADSNNMGVYPQGVSTMTTGEGKPFNVMQPYVVFNIWIRTA